jgi:5-methylcytosine-specific restriction endonuclease McrA
MIEDDSKVCVKCGRRLPATLEYFSRDRNGLRTNCRDCQREYYQQWQVNNRDKTRQYRQTYAAKHPALVAERHHEYWIANRERLIEAHRIWKERHSEQMAKYGLAWEKRHPDRASARVRNRDARKKGNGGMHTAADILAQCNRQKGRCYWCQKKVGDDYHVDHVVPICLGGSNGPENLVVSCAACNRKKGGKHPMEFAGVLL